MELDADPSRLAGGKGVFQGVLHQLVDHQGHRGGAVRGHNDVLAAHGDGDTAGGGQKGLEHVPADLLQNLKEGDLLPGDLYDAIQRGGQGEQPVGRIQKGGLHRRGLGRITAPAPGEVGEHLKVVFHAVPQLLKCSPLQGQLLL